MRYQPKLTKKVLVKTDLPEPEIPWVVENHLYVMPDDLESFLAVIAAIQEYYVQLQIRHANVNVFLIFDDAFEFLQGAFNCSENVLSVSRLHDLDDAKGLDLDHVVEFTRDRAQRVGGMTDKHLAQIFGIMVGSDPQRVIPNLSMLPLDPVELIDVIVMPFPDAKRFVEFVENNKPELSIKLMDDDWSAKTAYQAKMLVGVRSGMTYLAAALGTSVLEIYPPDEHRDLLSKWGHPIYQMIYADPATVRAELVYRAWEALWRRQQAFHTALQKSETLMDQSTSTAVNAESTSIE